MRIEELTPMLRTWDLEGSIAFYTQILGFTVQNQAEGWVSLVFDAACLMLSSPNDHEGDQAPRFTGSIYFRVDDVESVWQAVKDRAKICYPIETFPYGMREFAIYDNNGYLLQFGKTVQ